MPNIYPNVFVLCLQGERAAEGEEEEEAGVVPRAEGLRMRTAHILFSFIT